MLYLALLAALVLLPIITIVLFRVNGAIAFMSLCLGSVLIAYTSADVTDLVASFGAKGTLDVRQWAQIILLVAPFVLTILFTIKSVRGSGKLLNVLPAVASGMLFTLLIVPLLPADLQRHLTSMEAWRQLSNLQTSTILGGAMFSLVFLLLTHRRKGQGELEGKKKHSKH